MKPFDEWAAELVIVGDEAYLPGERSKRPWRRLTDEERATYKRDWIRRRRMDPHWRARERERDRLRHAAKRRQLGIPMRRAA